MRIIGLGVDLADISRIERMLVRYPRFAQRCFTPHEQKYAEGFARPARLPRRRRYAARYAGRRQGGGTAAARAALMKSFGAGYRQLRWTDIEITGGGKPTANLTGTAAARAALLGVTQVEVAITHTDAEALVFAVALGEHGDGQAAPS